MWLYLLQFIMLLELISKTDAFDCAKRSYGFGNPVSTLKGLNYGIQQNRNKQVFILFHGTPRNGVQWCRCCARAEPFIKRAAKYMPKNAVLIVVNVGGRFKWMRGISEFRNWNNFPIYGVPTLLDLNRRRTVTGSALQNVESLKYAFQGRYWLLDMLQRSGKFGSKCEPPKQF